ncbi:DUF962 domain-containing protein [Gallaecimonas sp. GXIMD4217]|uniref:DUF962 domain-containing protein n=1 Tax=Gallaecimonas sp. GXIMD4217 TaxID=3131927 RepID=UPI00311B1331
MKARYASFRAFYPDYLAEHRHPGCRRLHYLGNVLALLSLLAICLFSAWQLWWLPLLLGYGLAWLGHGLFEKNRPVTFRHPLYSLMGDWLMLWQAIRSHWRRTL